jgi:hypothetical protein
VAGDVIAYSSKELRQIAAVIRKMEDEAKDQARSITSFSTDFAVREITNAAGGSPAPKQAKKIAAGIRKSKTSVLGEFSLGFATQRFSGGATTQINKGREKGPGILAGVEFGSKRYKRFPPRSATFGGKGSEGYFIFPTLRRIQPQIIKKWEESFSKIVKEWDK